MSSIDQRPREPGKNEEQTASLGAVAHPSLPVQEMSTIQVALELAKRGIEVLSLSETEQRSKLTSVLQMDKDRSEYTKEEAEEVARTCSYDTLTYLLQKHGVRYLQDDLTTDAAKRERLKYHLLKRDLESNSFSDLISKLRGEVANFNQVSKRLADIGRELYTFVEREDQRLKASLLLDLPRYSWTMDRSLQQLAKGECPIIVTGEVATGKSAFLNLLLQGQDLRLPESEHESTSCVCEIKYGDRARVVAYHRSPKSGKDDKIEKDKTDTETLGNLINYDRFQEGRLPYTKVEIAVPLEMLKCGLVLVDTPGVASDRDEMETFVEDYIQRAAGFVYIVNKAIDVHRLCRLFAIEEKHSSKFLQPDSDCSDSDPSRQVLETLFIANKWDLIQDEEKMLQNFTQKLTTHWLVRGSMPKQIQLLPLAATRDVEHLRVRYLSERVERLVESLGDVISRNMKLQLRRHFGFFLLVCSRIEYHTQRHLCAVELMKNKEHQEVHDRANKELQGALKTRSTQCNQLQEYLQKLDISNIVSELRDYLQSPAVRDRIVDWKQSECPICAGSANEMEVIAKRKVEGRILQVIETWDDENHLLSEKRQEIDRKIQTLSATLEIEISAISRTLTPARPMEVEVPDFSFSLLPQPSLVHHTMLKTGSVTIAKPTPRTKSNSSESLAKTLKDCATAMLDNLREESQVRKLVKEALGLRGISEQFKDQVKRATNIKETEVKELKEVKETFTLAYEKLRKECLDIYKKLQLWEVENLFEGENIGYDKVTTDVEPFAKGRTAVYHRGTFTSRPENVIVKKYTTPSEIRAILQDYKWLRKQDSPFIAKALGVLSMNKTTELGMVLETCFCTLENWLHTPATSKELSISTVFELAGQLCNSLEVLHNSGYVHGELEPSTVMLVQDQTHCQSTARLRVKLYHAGFKKGTIRRLQTVYEGLTRYSAPDIAEFGETPDHNHMMPQTKRYDPSWDVYSLGQILADLDQAASQRYVTPEDVELKEVVTLTRPSINYQRLVLCCCSKDAIDRPSVDAVRQQLAAIRRAQKTFDTAV